MLGLNGELLVLWDAVAAGIVVMGSYDLIRVFRRIIKHKLYIITIEDFFYWVITGVFLFIQIYKTSDGNIRWYFVIGVSCGMILFHWIFNKAWALYTKIKKSIDKRRKTN